MAGTRYGYAFGFSASPVRRPVPKTFFTTLAILLLFLTIDSWAGVGGVAISGTVKDASNAVGAGRNRHG